MVAFSASRTASLRFSSSTIGSTGAADAGADTHEVWATGRSSLARLMSLIALGDFTSAYVAIRKGVDPTPVDVIQRLKAALVS